MAGNRLAGKQYTGYPAWCFIEVENYGRGTQTHIEKLTILDKWYSHLRAYLPVFYTKQKKIDEYNDKIDPKLQQVDLKLREAYHLYDSSMEGIGSCNPDEKEFILFIRGVFIDLDEITAESGLVDKENIEQIFEAG